MIQLLLVLRQSDNKNEGVLSIENIESVNSTFFKYHARYERKIDRSGTK